MLVTSELENRKIGKAHHYTRDVSRAANRSMGIMKRKKKIERTAKPFAARVCREHGQRFEVLIDSVNGQVRTTTP